jgi:hypothetical protein
MRALLSPDRPLKHPHRLAALIAVVYVALALLTSSRIPPFESADEGPHLLVSDHIARTGILPVIASRAEIAAMAAAGDVIGQWSIESHQPPLYYALGALLIAPTERADLTDYLRSNPLIFVRGERAGNANVWLHDPRPPQGDTHIALWILRGYSLVLSTLTLGLIYYGGRLATGSAAVGLTAMFTVAGLHTFASIGAAVNNDNLVTLLYSAGVVLMLRAWRDGLRWPLIAALSAVLTAIALTKITGLALFAIVYGALALGVYRGRFSLRQAALTVLITGVSAALLAGWWYVRNWTLYGDPIASAATQALWGRSFARPDESGDLIGEIVRVWRSFWFMTGHLHQPVYAPPLYYAVTTATAALGLLGWMVPRRPRLDRDTGLILGAAALLPVILLAAGTLQIDISYGRLLFPALIGAIPLLVLGWRRLVGSFAPLLALPLYAMTVLGIVQTLPDAYPQPVIVDRVPESAVPLDVRAGDLTLVAYERRSDAVTGGDAVRVDLYLRGAHPQNPALIAALLDAATLEPLAARSIYPATMPTDALAPGTLYRVPFVIPLDTFSGPPRLLRLQLGWQTILDTERYLPLTGADPSAPPLDVLLLDAATGVDWGYRAPDPQARAAATFGGAIALDGVTLDAAQVTAGGSVDVTLLWRFVQSMDADYVATLQLLDDAGGLVAQADGDVPGYPTSYWWAAPPFPDTRALAIPPETPPGTYRLWVGWYRLPDGARLPVIADGAVNDLAPLPVTLTVRGG